jgi:hypothetical protein
MFIRPELLPKSDKARQISPEYLRFLTGQVPEIVDMEEALRYYGPSNAVVWEKLWGEFGSRHPPKREP